MMDAFYQVSIYERFRMDHPPTGLAIHSCRSLPANSTTISGRRFAPMGMPSFETKLAGHSPTTGQCASPDNKDNDFCFAFYWLHVRFVYFRRLKVHGIAPHASTCR